MELAARESGRGEELVVAYPGRSSRTVVLSRVASGVTEIAHAPSGVRVEISLAGSTAAQAEIHDGYVMYPGGAPEGGDLLQRPSPRGLEDYAVFWSRPAAPELRYELGLVGARALREWGGYLEVLDGVGAPRLRIEPPWVVDGRGVRHGASIAVEGCPVDTDPRVPWRRSLNELGAKTSCKLVVRWAADLEAPLLVDPEWVFADDMVSPRTHHTATSLPSGDIFVAGGFDAAQAAVAQTEIFCPDDVCGAEGAFTVGPTLLAARGSHTATLVGGKVLLTGGASSYATSGGLASAELYDPAQAPPNDIVSVPALSTPRVGHTATLLPSGTTVLVAGGDAASPSTAEVFDATTATFGPALTMNARRRFHVAALAGNNHVLLAGGDSGIPNTVALSTAELYDPVNAEFHPIPNTMTANRAYATATPLSDGTVLIVGGTNLQGAYSPTADLFTPMADSGTFATQAIVLQVGRAGHTATPLVGQSTILIAGGYNPSQVADGGVLRATEIFVLGQLSSQLASDLQEPHNFHTALVQPSGRPVVMGGGKLGTVNAPGSGAVLVTSAFRAEILLRSNGDPCDSNAECASGNCYDLSGGTGVCCNEACEGDCESCRAVETNGVEGTCSSVVDDFPIKTQCVNEVAFSLVCVNGTVSIQGGQVDLCDGYACNAAGDACLTTCSLDADCGQGHYCAGQSCALKKNQGDSCDASNECLTGPCTDGYCCNSACGGQCEACDVSGSEGVCVQVPSGAPHGARPACEGAGTECEGTCGTNPTKCDYAQVSCGASTCTNGTESGGTCSIEEEGVCTPSTRSCEAYACDTAGERCFTACTDTEQCASGAICRSDDTCAAVSSAECDDSILVEPNGNTIDCAPFRCDGAGCLSRCVSIDDCVAGKVCDESGACIDPPPDPEPPADCSARPISSSTEAPSAALLLAIAALVSRGRRSVRKGGRR